MPALLCCKWSMPCDMLQTTVKKFLRQKIKLSNVGKILKTIKDSDVNISWNNTTAPVGVKRQVSELTNDIVFGAERVHNSLVSVASKALNDNLMRRASYFNKVLSILYHFLIYFTEYLYQLQYSWFSPPFLHTLQPSSSRSAGYIIKLAPNLSTSLGTDFLPISQEMLAIF